MPHDFITQHSEILLENPIIAVRRDDVVMPDGRVASREIVEHFGAVAVVAYDGANITMVRQYRRSVDQRLLELPAGLLDIAGEDEYTCAQRELAEEAGLGAHTWSVLVDVITSAGFCDEAVRIYLATNLHTVEQPSREDEELEMDVVSVPLTEAVKMVQRGEIVNSIAVSGILSAYLAIDGDGDTRPVSADFSLRPTALARRRQDQGIVPDMKKIPRG